MRISTKLISNLTRDEYEQCYRLNMGDEGMMRYQLVHEREYPTLAKMKGGEAYVVRALGDDGRLLGWCLLFYIDAQAQDRRAYFYVRKTHRRRGIGTKLMQAARRLERAPGCNPWCDAAEGFFARFPGVRYVD